MTGSRVMLGTGSNPGHYRGWMTALDGTSIRARIRAASGNRMTLLALPQLGPGGGAGAGSGSLSATAEGGE